MKKFAAIVVSVLVWLSLFSGAAVPAPAGNYPNPGDARIIRVEYRVSAFEYSVGTAFRVGPHSWLTAAHVVTNDDGKHLARVAAVKGLSIKVFEVVKVDASIDTALLYDPDYSGDYFSIAAGPTTRPVKGIGYPGDIFRPCSVFLSYATTQATRYGTYAVERPDAYAGKIWGGFSGGPVINASGAAVGMLVCGGGGYPGAIPAQTLTNFMKGE